MYNIISLLQNRSTKSWLILTYTKQVVLAQYGSPLGLHALLPSIRLSENDTWFHHQRLITTLSKLDFLINTGVKIHDGATCNDNNTQNKHTGFLGLGFLLLLGRFSNLSSNVMNAWWWMLHMYTSVVFVLRWFLFCFLVDYEVFLNNSTRTYTTIQLKKYTLKVCFKAKKEVLIKAK